MKSYENISLFFPFFSYRFKMYHSFIHRAESNAPGFTIQDMNQISSMRTQLGKYFVDLISISLRSLETTSAMRIEHEHEKHQQQQSMDLMGCSSTPTSNNNTNASSELPFVSC